jgi:hypothetical protein
MIVEITGVCGHTKTKDLKNRLNEEPTAIQLKKSVAYWSEKVCSDCYFGEQDKKLERFGELPELVGSEKQVGWATRIRKSQLLQVNEFLVNLLSYIDSLDLTDLDVVSKCYENVSTAEEKAKLVASVSDAKFWIDTRDEEATILIGTVDSRDHKVKLDLETREVVLSSRAGTKLVEMSSQNETSPGRVIRVGGTKFHDRKVN